MSDRKRCTQNIEIKGKRVAKRGSKRREGTCKFIASSMAVGQMSSIFLWDRGSEGKNKNKSQMVNKSSIILIVARGSQTLQEDRSFFA
jgi:hypothetical protein